MSGVEPRGARPWWLLASFCLVVVSTQVAWLSFAPVSAEAARVLGVSEGAVGDLAVVNPLLFVLLALPAGRLVDRHLRLALVTGALLTAAGTAIRTLHSSTGEAAYAWAMGGQLVLSVGQPIVLAATTAVAARCLPERHRAAAITAGAAAQFVGVLVGALGGVPLVQAGGLDLLLRVHAGLALLGLVLLAGALAGADVAPVPPSTRQPLRALARDRLLVLLAALLFVGVGLFNALATWLEPLMAERGHPGLGGVLLAVTTVAGLVGSAFVPGLAASRGRRRETLLAATVVATAVCLTLTLVATPLAVGVLLAVLGLPLLACLPVALEWSELHVGPALAGSTTAALLLFGNLGGVVLVLAVQPFVARPAIAYVVLAAFGVLGALAALRLPTAGVVRTAR